MRNVVLAALGVLVLAAVALVGVRWLAGGSEPAAALAEVPIGGPFTLTDQNGRRVTDEEFRGRLMLVYFGYTFCPDMCPLGLQHDRRRDRRPAAGAPGPGRAGVHHRRPGARHVGRCCATMCRSSRPRLVGLTGSEAEIAGGGPRLPGLRQQVRRHGRRRQLSGRPLDLHLS